MNLNSVLFPAPSCSYDYNKLKGQLIFIPKWKKVPVKVNQASKIISSHNSSPKTLNQQQKKPISKLFNSFNDVIEFDRTKIIQAQIINPIFLSQKTNDRKILPNPPREKINSNQLNNILRAPRSYASNSFNIVNKHQHFVSNKNSASSSKDTAVNSISPAENNINMVRRTVDIVSKDCNQEKTCNSDESYMVEDQEEEQPKSVAFNKDFKFIKNSNTRCLRNSKSEMIQTVNMPIHMPKKPHKYPLKYVDELKSPSDKNNTSTNFDTCIFDENVAHNIKNNSTTNELSRAHSPNNVSKYNINNSRLLNQHLRNPFTSFFLPLNLKAEDHDNICLLNNYRINCASVGIPTNTQSLANFSDSSRSVVFGGNMTVDALNNEKLVSKTQLMTAFTNVVDCYIPCIYLEPTTPSNKILIYFHGNGEDINLANDLMIHIKNTMNVFFLNENWSEKSNFIRLTFLLLNILDTEYIKALQMKAKLSKMQKQSTIISFINLELILKIS